MARASTFTQEIADEIVDRIASGEPLRVICRDEHMPAWRTVYDWLDNNQTFAARFARARELGEDAIAQQCLEIADNERHDWVLTKKGEITNEVAIGRAKLQVDTRLKLLAKWNPKRWGEKQQIEHSGKMSLEQLIAESMAPAAPGADLV
jgi:hypothetical protein